MPTTRTHEQIFCRTCQRQTLHFSEAERPNHVLHLLMTLFVCGLWLPIWLIACITVKWQPWRCSFCGQRFDIAPTESVAQRLRPTEEQRAKAERVAETLAAQREQAAAAARAKVIQRRETVAEGLVRLRNSFLAPFGVIDESLKWAAGDDAFMHWFFRSACASIASAGVAFLIYRLMR